jgi:hypothetical protein
MLTQLMRMATADGQTLFPRPAEFIFHIYRSMEDLYSNLAVARVDFINPHHPKAERFAKHWESKTRTECVTERTSIRRAETGVER